MDIVLRVRNTNTQTCSYKEMKSGNSIKTLPIKCTLRNQVKEASKSLKHYQTLLNIPAAIWFKKTRSAGSLERCTTIIIV